MDEEYTNDEMADDGAEVDTITTLRPEVPPPIVLGGVGPTPEYPSAPPKYIDQYPLPSLKTDVIIVEFVGGEEVYGPPQEGKPTVPRGQGDREAQRVMKNGLYQTHTDPETGMRTTTHIPPAALIQIRVLTQVL